MTWPARLRIVLTAGGLLMAPAVAHAGPVAAAIATAVGAGAVATAVIEVVVFAVANVAISAVAKALSPKRPGPASQERQASVTQLALGEGPREWIVGEAATAGQLVDAFNHGGDYGTDYETLVIQLAAHKCTALVGFYVGDAYYTFSANGVQSGFNNQLEVYWYDGAIGQAASAQLAANSGGRWISTDRMTGICYVVVTYKADKPDAQNPVWPQGRPSFLWRVKGARLYDPRLDSTVAGGSGSHRWNNPATWAWSDNAALARYAFQRGIYAGDDNSTLDRLMLGRGLSEIEADPARVIAWANLCDEAVALKAGGTEKRYRANGVIRSDESFIAVEEMFAAAMAGIIVQRDGGVDIEPGAAKSAVATITDADLPIGLPVKVEQFLSQSERVNTVAARYTEPAQLWRDTQAPIRRSLSDISADGGPFVKQVGLSLVTSQTQAQRVAEIERRMARLERRATLTLGPRFAYLEEGDWITWTSDRHFSGASITFRIEAISTGADYRSQVVLREINASVFTWTAATDEGTPGQAPLNAAGALSPLTLSGVTIQTVDYVGAGGVKQPAVKAIWSTPIDAAIEQIRLELRIQGSAEIAATFASAPGSGQMTTTNGVAAGLVYEGRLVPLGADGRRSTPTSWTVVTTGGLTAGGLTLGSGRNLLQYATFPRDLRGWSSQSNSTGFTLNIVRNLAGYFGVNNVITASVVGTPALNAFFSVGTASGSMVPINGGERLEASAWLAVQNAANGFVVVQFWTAAAGGGVGSFISSAQVGTGGSGWGGGNGDTANFARVGGFVTAPANAKYAQIVAGVNCNGSGSNPLLVMTRPYLGIATAGQTELSPWHGGYEGEGGADITASNTAAAISGQGALATKSSVATADVNAGAITNVSTSAQTWAGGNLNSVEQSIFGAAISSQGGEHVLSFESAFTNSGAAAGVAISIYRNGSLIATKTFFCQGSFADSKSYRLRDQPGSGTWTYTLGMRTTPGSGTGLLPTLTDLVNQELKR